MTSGAKTKLAVRMKDVSSDEIPNDAPNQEVGWKVVATGKACTRDRESGAIGEGLHPRFRIFMRNRGCHDKGKHHVTGRKGSVDAVISEKGAFSGAFKRPLPGGQQLHRGVHRKGIGQGFQT